MITIIGFIINLSKTNTSIRMDNKLNTNELKADLWSMREKIDETIKDFHQELKGIHQELKDFHGRLCTLEERYLQIITKERQ
jgi:hypothetical protein